MYFNNVYRYDDQTDRVTRYQTVALADLSDIELGVMDSSFSVTHSPMQLFKVYSIKFMSKEHIYKSQKQLLWVSFDNKFAIYVYAHIRPSYSKWQNGLDIRFLQEVKLFHRKLSK